MLVATVKIVVDTSYGDFDVEEIGSSYTSAGYDVIAAMDEASTIVELTLSYGEEYNLDLMEVFNVCEWDEDLQIIVSYYPGLASTTTMNSFNFYEMCSTQGKYQWLDGKLFLFSD